MGRASVLPFLFDAQAPSRCRGPFVLLSGIRAGSAGSRCAHASNSAQCNTFVISCILLSISLTLVDAISTMQPWFKTAVTRLQVTREQRSFSLRMFHRSWGLMLIQQNISAPSALLDFPSPETTSTRRFYTARIFTSSCCT